LRDLLHASPNLTATSMKEYGWLRSVAASSRPPITLPMSSMIAVVTAFLGLFSTSIFLTQAIEVYRSSQGLLCGVPAFGGEPLLESRNFSHFLDHCAAILKRSTLHWLSAESKPRAVVVTA
jgi:hypothetical protein